MDGSTNHEAIFSELLQDEINQSEKLNNLLIQEYELLLSNSPNLLEQLAERKKQIIARLEETVARQKKFLGRFGYVRNHSGVETYIKSLAESKHLVSDWERLKELLACCQKQNEINSAVVALGQRQISNTLELLYDLSGGEKTYGRSGETQANRLSKSLGKA
jgi:flagellar biosynthesis/type III secretory pathway chaperone